jgi:hypothetical protein
VPHTAEGEQWRAGADGLVTFALLHAGEAIDDPDLSASSPLMSAALDRLRAAPPDRTYATYLHSVRAQALALANRGADRDQLVSDQQWLLKAARDGAYAYVSSGDPGWTQWDHSNSQYGVLGVWAASDAGVAAPASYWQDVERHWVRTQNSDGGWPYSDSRGSTATMTAAGVTTLCVAADQEVVIADVRGAAAVRRPPRATGNRPAPGRPVPPPPVTTAELTVAIDRGLACLGKDDVVLTSDRDEGYTLYGLERAALATGRRFFGSHDWYRELGARQLAAQLKDGSWDGGFGPPIETAFRLLFLARGRQPLLMDKLRFDGDWNDRPRDVAKLAGFVSAELERPFAWGVAELDRDWSDWLDAPLLFITTDAPPTFSDDDVRKLRAYSDAGGLILLHNEFAAKPVDAFVTDLAGRLFPEYRLAPVPPTDLLYRTVFNMTGGTGRRLPPLAAVNNGSRTLLVYSPSDITKDWIAWRPRSGNGNPGLQMGLNLFVAAAGKGDFRNRLDTPDVGPPAAASVRGTVPVQRLTYPGGRWDPEPAAWPRFGRWFFRQTSLTLDLRPTELGAVDLLNGPVAVLTGNRPVDFGRLDLRALRDFVRDGGTLLVDAAGGDRRFDAAVRDQLLPAAFPGATLAEMPPDHPILAGAGTCMTPLPKPRLRKFASAQLGLTDPPGVQCLAFGAGTVVVSDLDVTTALLHCGTYGILGYTPAYADALCQNTILWTLSRVPPPRLPTAPAATGPAQADGDGR